MYKITENDNDSNTTDGNTADIIITERYKHGRTSVRRQFRGPCVIVIPRLFSRTGLAICYQFGGITRRTVTRRTILHTSAVQYQSRVSFIAHIWACAAHITVVCCAINEGAACKQTHAKCR